MDTDSDVSTHYTSECSLKNVHRNTTEMSDNEAADLLMKMTEVSNNEVIITTTSKNRRVICRVCQGYVHLNVINRHLLSHFRSDAVIYLIRKVRIQQSHVKCKVKGCAGRKTTFTNETYMDHLLLVHGMFRRWMLRYKQCSFEEYYYVVNIDL